VPETKNKTLEKLDVYFSSNANGIAVKDRERMRRIEESLRLAGVQGPEDSKVEEGEETAEHAESVEV
jgi:hypothetical protein